MPKAVRKANPATLDATERQRDDYYATPAALTRQLLEMWPLSSRTIWEPACGDGRLAEVLRAQGHSVAAFDLVPRGYGTGGIDFLLEWQRQADTLITNPPFKLASAFARHALQLGVRQMALLVKLGFLEGPQTADLQDGVRAVNRILFVRRRPTFWKNGVRPTRSDGKGGFHAYCWCIWDHMHVGPPTFGWIEGEPCL